MHHYQVCRWYCTGGCCWLLRNKMPWRGILLDWSIGQSSMIYLRSENLTTRSYKFCAHDEVILSTGIDWERSGWRTALKKGIWFVLTRKANPILGCIKQHCQLVQRVDYPTVFSVGTASPWAQCAVLCLTIKEFFCICLYSYCGGVWLWEHWHQVCWRLL